MRNLFRFRLGKKTFLDFVQNRTIDGDVIFMDVKRLRMDSPPIPKKDRVGTLRGVGGGRLDLFQGECPTGEYRFELVENLLLGQGALGDL